MKKIALLSAILLASTAAHAVTIKNEDSTERKVTVIAGKDRKKITIGANQESANVGEKVKVRFGRQQIAAENDQTITIKGGKLSVANSDQASQENKSQENQAKGDTKEGASKAAPASESQQNQQPKQQSN